MITRRSLVQAAAAAGATHWLSAANAQTTMPLQGATVEIVKPMQRLAAMKTASAPSSSQRLPTIGTSNSSQAAIRISTTWT